MSWVYLAIGVFVVILIGFIGNRIVDGISNSARSRKLRREKERKADETK